MTLTLEGREKQMKKVTTIAAKTREEIQGRPQEARLRVAPTAGSAQIPMSKWNPSKHR